MGRAGIFTYMNGDIFYGKLVGKLYHGLSSLGLLNGNFSPKQLLFFEVNCPISFTVDYFSPTIFICKKTLKKIPLGTCGPDPFCVGTCDGTCGSCAGGTLGAGSGGGGICGPIW